MHDVSFLATGQRRKSDFSAYMPCKATKYVSNPKDLVCEQKRGDFQAKYLTLPEPIQELVFVEEAGSICHGYHAYSKAYEAKITMGDKSRQSSQAKRRNRGLLSCTECHRRKQKCDRLQPCNDCIQRGLPQRCKYIKPVNPASDSGQPGSVKATKSRLKRIMTGEEVLLSPESIESLASYSSGTSTLALRPSLNDKADADLHHQTYPKGGRGWMSPDAAGSFPIQKVVLPTVSSGLNAGIQFRFLGGFDPFASFPGCNEEPIPKQLLVHYYLARLAPWLSYLDDNIKHDRSPRLAWLEYAINHTPLFYATLLTAVVHLNRRRPLKDPSAMIWFKLQTVKLANEKMHDPVEACRDEMLIVALVLLYFNVRGNDAEEYEIHLRGIHDMLKLRGGTRKLGMRGMVKNWLDVCYGPWSPGWEYGYFTRLKGEETPKTSPISSTS